MAPDFIAALRLRRRPTHLTTCSICLDVLRGSDWLEAEHVIREIRSYELAEPPRLGCAVCDSCAEAIARRRLYPESEGPLAA